MGTLYRHPRLVACKVVVLVDVWLEVFPGMFV